MKIGQKLLVLLAVLSTVSVLHAQIPEQQIKINADSVKMEAERIVSQIDSGKKNTQVLYTATDSILKHTRQIRDVVLAGQPEEKYVVNRRYNQLYLINFPVSYAVPFAEGNLPYRRWYVLNADVRVPFNLFPKYWRVSLIAVARFQARIIGSQYSLPVRTPSFMPGAVLFVKLNSRTNTNTQVREKFNYLSFDVFHHSNGQDGHPVTKKGTDQINLYNGNFSTNFLCANYHWGSTRKFRLLSHKIGVEGHWNNEKAFAKYFGQIRLNYSFQLSGNVINFLTFRNKYKNIVRTHQEENDEELWRLVVNTTVMLNNLHAGASHYFNAELMAIRKIGGSPNAGLFAAIGWCGHDDYNVYFRQTYAYARLGVVFTPGFRYGLTSGQPQPGKREPYIKSAR